MHSLNYRPQNHIEPWYIDSHGYLVKIGVAYIYKTYKHGSRNSFY